MKLHISSKTELIKHRSNPRRNKVISRQPKAIASELFIRPQRNDVSISVQNKRPKHVAGGADHILMAIHLKRLRRIGHLTDTGIP